MKKMKWSLIIIPLAAFGSIIVLASVSAASGGSATATSRTMMGITLAVIYGSIILCAIISARYARRLNRSAGGWVLANIFLPFISPIALGMAKPAPAPAPYSPPAGNESSAPGQSQDERAVMELEGFCEQCIRETTDESPGNVSATNGIGTMLMGTRWSQKGLHPCPRCGSVIQTKWVTFGFGIKPLGTYRIRYLKKGFINSRFFGRRLKNDPCRIRP